MWAVTKPNMCVVSNNFEMKLINIYLLMLSKLSLSARSDRVMEPEQEELELELLDLSLLVCFMMEINLRNIS